MLYRQVGKRFKFDAVTGILYPVCLRNRYLLIPLVDFANHDDDIAYAVCPGDGIFTELDEVRYGRTSESTLPVNSDRFNEDSSKTLC